MHQSKLIQLLKSLDADEFKQFSKFVRSPIYNTNPTIVKLYDVLKAAYPKLDSAKLAKEKVYQKLYPGQSFQYHPMANLMTAMRKLVEDYLVYLEHQRDAFHKKHALTQAYGRRDLYAFFEKNTEKLVTAIEQAPYRGFSYYRSLFDLKYNLFFHPLKNRYKTNDDTVNELMNLLDRHFVMLKMHLRCEQKTRELSMSKTYEVEMAKEVFHLSQIYSRENHLFQLYYILFLIQESPEKESNFYLAKNHFTKLLNSIKESEQKFIFQNLLNYSIRKINQGQFEYNKETFQLYKLGIKNNLIIENKKIAETTFNNIVSTASALKEIDWAYRFIHKNMVFLDIESREDIKTLSIAELNFSQNDFDLVTTELSNTQFTNAFYQIKSKFLLIKTWYEKFLMDDSYLHLLTSQIDSFSKFLKRDKTLSKNNKDGIFNFLKVTKLILANQNKLKRSKEYQQNTLSKINNYKYLNGRAWLIDKISDL